MKRECKDMYALFRHDAHAERYFESQPSYVQDEVRSQYKSVDSFDRLVQCILTASELS